MVRALHVGTFRSWSSGSLRERASSASMRRPRQKRYFALANLPRWGCKKGRFFGCQWQILWYSTSTSLLNSFQVLLLKTNIHVKTRTVGANSKKKVLASMKKGCSTIHKMKTIPLKLGWAYNLGHPHLIRTFLAALFGRDSLDPNFSQWVPVLWSI